MNNATNIEFQEHDQKTFVAETKHGYYEIERSLLDNKENSVVVCSDFEHIDNLSSCYRLCNNIHTFFSDQTFFWQYRLYECYQVNIVDENNQTIDIVIDNNFDTFCRAFCKYILETNYGTYHFSFIKCKALKKNEEGFIPLEKICDLNSTEMLLQITRSKVYLDYERKLLKNNK